MKQYKHIYLVIFSLIVTSSWAQSIEITPSYGFQFGNKLHYGSNYLQIEDSDQYGITVGYEMDSGLVAELMYFRHSTQLNIRDIVFSPTKSKLADLSGDWILIGATKYFSNEKVRPFAGGGLGIVLVSPKNENYTILNRGLDNQTKFTFSFKAGVNIMFSDVVGLNLQGNIFLPIEYGGFYIGGGSGGVSGGVEVSSTTVVGGFSGGLVFRLN